MRGVRGVLRPRGKNISPPPVYDGLCTAEQEGLGGEGYWKTGEAVKKREKRKKKKLSQLNNVVKLNKIVLWRRLVIKCTTVNLSLSFSIASFSDCIGCVEYHKNGVNFVCSIALRNSASLWTFGE